MINVSSEDIHGTIDPNRPEQMRESVMNYVRTDFPRLTESLTVEKALAVIRRQGIGERIVYFYVLDNDEKLTGVVPTRRLLTSQPETSVAEIMVRRCVTVSSRSTVLDVCELFVKHKLLAFPVVDENDHMIGVIDAGLFSAQEMTFAKRKDFDDIFQMIGFGVSQIRGKSPFGLFRYRFPWLLATMASGLICAFLTGMYEVTLAQSLVLAFFMTLVLALGESVSIQSMTVALQNLHFVTPSFRDYLSSLRSEATAAGLLGLACGVSLALITVLWHGAGAPAIIIGGTVVMSVTLAGIIGLSVPTLLHAVHEESKIASGPLTLALADIATVLLYFNAAVLILK